MSERSLKDKIKTAIDQLEDEWTIRELAEILGLNEPIYDLSQQEMAMVAHAREEIAAGKVKSHEEVMAGAREWISKSSGQSKLSDNFEPI